jgi:1,4-dihydroxy-2-naphthoate octaprenyltransferase
MAVPSGLLTASILISHDMIFHDAYQEAGKRTIAVVLGRGGAAKLVSWMGVTAYAVVFALVALGLVPLPGLAVVLALPLTARYVDFGGRARAPPEYGPRTRAAFFHSVAFTLLLAAGLLLG